MSAGVSTIAPRLESIVLDAADPGCLARFYSALLDRPITRVDGGWYDLQIGDGLRVCIQHAPDHRPPTWPSWEVPQQIHLDFTVSDLDGAVRRAVDLGARHADRPADPTAGFRVLIDPAGHPFCLCQG